MIARDSRRAAAICSVGVRCGPPPVVRRRTPPATVIWPMRRSGQTAGGAARHKHAEHRGELGHAFGDRPRRGRPAAMAGEGRRAAGRRRAGDCRGPTSGTGKGRFGAFASGTGKELWSWQGEAGVNAPPISYWVGRQTIRGGRRRRHGPVRLPGRRGGGVPMRGVIPCHPERSVGARPRGCPPTLGSEADKQSRGASGLRATARADRALIL